MSRPSGAAAARTRSGLTVLDWRQIASAISALDAPVKANLLGVFLLRKYLRAEGVEERRRYQRPTVPSKLAPFVESIKQAVLVDARRPKTERRTAKALLKQIS